MKTVRVQFGFHRYRVALDQNPPVIEKWEQPAGWVRWEPDYDDKHNVEERVLDAARAVAL